MRERRFLISARSQAFVRRFSGVSLVILIFASCNAALGIHEPIDPPGETGGKGGTAGTAGSLGGGGGESGEPKGGSGGTSATGGSGGTSATGGSGAVAGSTGDTGGEAGGSGVGGYGDAGGGAAGTGGTGPIVITTETLPGARLNIDFELQLQASGGDGGPYTWELSDVLPATLGVVLGSDGRLHGAPTSTGSFELDVTATDGESSDTQRLTLNVSRSRWLVYESDEEAYYKFYLYAVDVTTEPPSKVRLPGEVSPSVEIPEDPHFKFSPDGKYLAYLANVDFDDELGLIPRLYVVDMTGDAPGDPVRVSGGLSDFGSQTEFSWSPDSRGLAFSVAFAQGVTPYRVYYAPVSALTAPREVGDIFGQDQQWDAMGWIGPDLLTYSSFSAIAYTRPFVNVQGQPFEQLFTGSIQQSWPERETALVRTIADVECIDGTWNLVDFRESSPVPQEFIRGYVIASPGLEYLAYRDPDTKRYDIYRPWETTSIAWFESAGAGYRNCSPGAWSRDASVFVAGGDVPGGVEELLVVTTITNGVASPDVLSGDYGNVGQREPPVFSPNDEWLGFSTTLGAFVARNTDGEIGNVVPVDPDALPVSDFGAPLIRFSPNSKLVASADFGTQGLIAHAFVASLETGQPEGSSLELGMSEDSSFNLLEWSPHSTELAFVARSSSWAPQEIYLGRKTPNGFVVNKLNAPTSCSQEDPTCEMVRIFAFQP